jgi:hypothetical protein
MTEKKYDKDEMVRKAIDAIREHNLYFVEDIIAYLPMGKTAFYEYFPNTSNEYKMMYDLLEVNRTSQKVKMRKKWSDSDNASLQMGLMKLIATDEERKRLATSYMETKQKHEVADLSGLSTDEIINLLNDDEQ